MKRPIVILLYLAAISVVSGFVVIARLTSGQRPDPNLWLAGQNNADLTFYGLAVDQDGRPLQGVSFNVTIDAIPKDWTFSTRGKPHVRTTRAVMTDSDGRFAVSAAAHLLFVEDGRLPGYRHFFSEWSDDGNIGYQVTSSGRQLYKSAATHPAIYVFVKDGVHEVAALPSRGGYYAYGPQWIPNQPHWPNRPSLTDVVPKPPLTTTTGQEAPSPPKDGPAQ